MLEAMFESTVKEKLLLFLLANDGSYPSEIARNFSFNLNAVQYQLKKLEKAGILYSELRGKVRLYGLDPRYPFSGELQMLLRRTFALIGAAEKAKYYVIRPRLRQAAVPYENFLSEVNRPVSVEKTVKNRRPAPKPQYLPRKSEPLDFSID
jgi:DNA-binding transcriptional ArsR family regulator